MSISVEFRASGRGAAQCPADPNYPDGIDIDASEGLVPFCVARLPYPAPECGVFLVSCSECLKQVAITAAGRADDPKTVQIACLEKIEGRPVIVVCRRASEPPKEGIDQRGWKCMVCCEELAMSAGAVARVQAGGRPLCNPCGHQYMELAERLGKVSGVHLTSRGFDWLVQEIRKNEGKP